MYVVDLEEADSREGFGFKAAELAGLQKSGFPVPKGFVIAPHALQLFISRNGLEEKIRSALETAERGPAGTMDAEKEMRELFTSALIPTEIRKEIVSAYEKLSLSEDVKRADMAALELIKMGRSQERVAVRPSVMTDHGKSFAGLTKAFLNVSGEDELWKFIKLCWVSLFYPLTSLYKERMGMEGQPAMSVIVQRMVDSEKGGAMFINFGNDKLLVEASWGLGETVSSGLVTPDEYLLDKKGALLGKNISKKLWMHVRSPMSGKTEKEHTPGSKMDAQVLTEVELKKLCELSDKLQTGVSEQRIVDWCIARNRVFILDTKPGSYEIIGGHEELDGTDVLVTGRCASPGTAAGGIVLPDNEVNVQFNAENIVVSENSSSDMLLSFPDIGGFVTNEGGRLCNFAILARELKIPALTATQNATSILKDSNKVKLFAEQGKVVKVQEEIVRDVQEYPEASPEVETPQFPSETTEHETAPIEKPVSATKTFVKVGPAGSERIEGVDGFIMIKGTETDILPGSEIDNIRALGGLPVWLGSSGEHDFSEAVNAAKGFEESGLTGVSLLIPATRGRRDVERWRHQTPSSMKLGATIKTPAMALSVPSLLEEEIRFINLELRSLVQLSMGLERPDAELHSAVLDMISTVAELCREKGAKCCVSVPAEYLTEENIESVIRRGVDVICVEPGMVENLKDIMVRAEKKILLESGASKNEPETTQDSGQDEFSPSSFSLL